MNEEWTQTYLSKMIYREIEPLVYAHFKKKQTQKSLEVLVKMH